MENIAIKFITPLETDKFTEHKTGSGYCLEFELSSARFDVKNEGSGFSIEFIETDFKTDYQQAKIMGYIVCKILPMHESK